MNHHRHLVTLAVLLMIASAASAAFTTYGSYSATELYNSAGSFTVIEGLALDGDELLFGQFTDVMNYDLTAGAATDIGDLPSNAGISVLASHGATTHVAFGLSYNSPYPYKMGTLDGSGAFVEQLAMDGIYDLAISPAGDAYLVANPAAAGSTIYRYDWQTSGVTEIADVGGNTGGLAFDADGNLYYSRYNTGEIWRFDAADVAGGGLTANDAQVALTLDRPGYLDFDADGTLLATWLDTSWNSTLSRFDLDTGAKIEDIAGPGIGKFVAGNGAIYAIDTDWGAYASTVQEIVPEPASMLLAGGAGLVLLRRRR